MTYDNDKTKTLHKSFLEMKKRSGRIERLTDLARRFGVLGCVYVLILIGLGGLLVILCSGCTMPSSGWFRRIEFQTNQAREAVEKIEVHTRASADTIKDAKIQAERKELLSNIETAPDRSETPDDNNTGDWLETLIYILLGVSGFGVLGGRHVLKKAVIGVAKK